MKLKIDDGIYSKDLRELLWKLQFQENYHATTIKFILRLIKIDFLSSENKDLSKIFNDEEVLILKNVDLISLVENKEINARWFDALLAVDRKNIYSNVERVRLYYYEVYTQTKDYQYLIRSISMIKAIKHLFIKDFDIVLDQVRIAISESNSAFYQQRLIKELISAYDAVAYRDEFSVLLYKQIEKYQSQFDFRSAGFCFKSLNDLKSLTNNEFRICLATNCELEGDHLTTTKEPNIFYPTISKVYLNGLKEIQSVEGCESLRSRLEEKVSDAQAQDAKMVQQLGINMIPKLNMNEIKNFVASLDCSNFQSTFYELLNLPFVPSLDEKESIEEKPESFIEKYFSKRTKINDKGSQVAHLDISKTYENDIRNYNREKILIIIHELKRKLDEFEEVDGTFIDQLLNDNITPFIPEDRKYIYLMGLLAGFNNNFILAAHLLMPQIENSLRYLAAKNGIILTSLEEELQYENTLGGCLQKIRSLAEPDVIDELVNFLTDGNGVNFRNELCHGLMSTELINKHGMYLWWISLKLIIQTKVLFPNLKG